MRTFPLILLALIACALLMSSCASSVRPSVPTSPPQRSMPEQAARPCHLHRLPDAATAADLETALIIRGAAIVACDAARQLAVDVHAGEHRDEAAWLKDAADRRRSWWQRILP